MELALINESGKPVKGGLTASDELFARDYNESLVHQLVTAFLANARQGTRAQKGRSEIAKSTRKPWKQKGTGRARAGMASSPLWRGGGKTFPNLPDENFTQKVNRKMYRAGMATILSQLAREERLTVVESFDVEAPKTKLLADRLTALGLKEVLIITDEVSENLYLSCRNLPHVYVVPVSHADPVSLVGSRKVLMTKAAVAKIEEMWA
ncbi:MAG: 50S ribosomal protein L4 [Betaproteobacteria bacterium]|nr:50S ribosomal protein L4 [Betaproteobacteria bacterium]NBS92695.1 50S ribosomal protein L4 [Betaproteobacteria bacterium]NBY52482.1 50S ribosomal protein L4 [Betaproteobacteria bacterium]NCA23972.1 50S ribosomal protein L4 [Betaproteobacteria bacterium]NCU84669.1 50S ribosomal protein L4 [Betaproteobacteria bacterium]